MSILVTGASAGFGAAICRTLVQSGYKVIGAARRLDKLELLRQQLGDSFYPLAIDVSKPESIDQGLDSLPQQWKQIDLLVNNAGLALGLEPAYEADFHDWKKMIDTNVIGLIYLTRKVLPQMIARDRGYIINLGSIAGTYAYPGGHIYGATKAFVAQFSMNLRADLAGKNIRVSNIEPGLCGGTEFSNVRFRGDDERAANLYRNVKSIQPEDIANTVLWLYQLPTHMNVNRIEIMPVAQTFSALNVARENEK